MWPSCTRVTECVDPEGGRSGEGEGDGVTPWVIFLQGMAGTTEGPAKSLGVTTRGPFLLGTWAVAFNSHQDNP